MSSIECCEFGVGMVGVIAFVTLVHTIRFLKWCVGKVKDYRKKLPCIKSCLVWMSNLLSCDKFKGLQQGQAAPLIYLRPVDPQAGQAWRAGVKIKIIFSFEGKGIQTPYPYGTIRELATN